MTPYEIEIKRQENADSQDEINASLYLDGASDAALGISPANREAAYLAGYLEQLRILILTSPATLQIRWLSPAYISGGYDAPGEF